MRVPFDAIIAPCDEGIASTKETTVINWKVSKHEHELINIIADRAVAVAASHGNHSYDKLHATMDLTACHANGCRLDLQGLAGAESFDFTHDVFGIARHINRETGKLENCFVPRYAEKSSKPYTGPLSSACQV